MGAAVFPLLATAFYLTLLWLVARWADSRPSMEALARNPITQGLALGVYCTSWTLYGSVGYAAKHGYEFLAISLGVVLSCLAIPALWTPIGDIVRRHNLTSVADLLALRFGSQAVASWVTLLLVAGLLPYLSLQMRAISDAGAWLSPGSDGAQFGALYAFLLVGFTVILGARYSDPRAQRPGLMVALALESLVKGFLYVAVGVAALYGVFGGLEGLQSFLEARPEASEALSSPLRGGGAWGALLVTTFAAAFLLPRQFHVAFVEPTPSGTLRRGSWVLPLYLLVLNLPIPILLWAGKLVAPPGTVPDNYVMAVSTKTGTALVAFLAGVSASSAMILVCTIALTGMVVNHLVLPFNRKVTWSVDALLTLRRVVMTTLVVAGFGAHLLLPDGGSIVNLGLVSFVAVLQLLPGVLATLFWRGASRRGLLLGLAGGSFAWLGITAFPLLGGQSEALGSLAIPLEPRSLALLGSVGVNTLFFALGSMIWPPGPQDLQGAEFCLPYGSIEPQARDLPSLQALRSQLVLALGARTADALMDKALQARGLEHEEKLVPRDLRRLVQSLERELAQLVGPLGAKEALGLGRPGEGMDSLAAQLEQLRVTDAQGATQVYGRERVLEGVQRYLLTLLEELPLGIVAVDDAGEITLWNLMMQGLSGYGDEQALGAELRALPAPWDVFLANALTLGNALHERPIAIGGRSLVLRVRPITLAQGAGRALIIEDLTERRALRAQAAHQDRLASIGRLAAGVAHEILNPLTGVLMVARNLELEPGAEDSAERLGLIVTESKRIETIVRDLLGYSRMGIGGNLEWIDLTKLSGEALRLTKLVHQGEKPVFKVDIPVGLGLWSQRQSLLQVLSNLLANAKDASKRGGRIWLSAWEEGDWVHFQVQDEGEGVDEQLRDHIFEPFVTTKAPGEGTGLGLSVSHRIIQDLGGHLSLEEITGPGACFSLRLPRSKPPSQLPPRGKGHGQDLKDKELE